MNYKFLNLKKSLGQIQISTGVIGLIITGIGFVVTPVVAYFSGQSATTEKIFNIESRTAVLENSIKNTDMNVREIKDDIKDIKKAFNIK